MPERRGAEAPPLLPGRGFRSAEGWSALARGRPRVGVLLPRPLAARPGRSLDARRQLHRLVLVEDPRQGRDRRLGDAADRLPVERPRHAGVRAARLSARAPRSPGTSTRRCACATRTSAARCSSCTARRWREPATRSRRGRRSSTTRRRRAPTSRSAARAASSACSWDEVAELIAAAHVHTIRRYGPDRIAGFSPIPAMSMVSYAAGTRFLSLIGGVCLSFYDWYADLPPASPQIWGDQTDVPESADWWNAGYVILWGSNIPQTRTPDAHFMTEARYRGQKVVVVSPDFAGHTKFADHWLPATAGSDGALAMAMGHVILKEFYVERQVPYFERYARENTDLPFLVTLERARAAPTSPTASCALPTSATTGEHAEWKTVVLDETTGEPAVAERLDRLPLGRGGDGSLEPRARRDRARADAARPPRRARRARAASLRRRRRRAAAARSAAACPAKRVGGPAGHDGLRPARRPARRAPRRAAGRVAGRLRRPAAVHARLAGGSTRASTHGARHARRPRVRPQRRAHERPLDDRDGRRHQPLVPLRPDLPGDAQPRPALRLPGRERRRLGALRRPGEGAPDHRLVDARLRARLEPAAAPAGDDAVLVPDERPVALPAHARRRVRLAGSDAGR